MESSKRPCEGKRGTIFMTYKNVARAIILFMWIVSFVPSNHSASAAASIPPADMFQLPWEQGQAWVAIDGFDDSTKRSTTSPHYYLNGGAIDFAPHTNMIPGENTSNFWVTAVANGTVSEISKCHIKIDHGNGWVSEYQHLAKIQVRLGDAVTRNQKLAVIANATTQPVCPGSVEPDIPHLHFSLRPNMVGATFGGWKFNYNSFWNNTTFSKDGTTVGLFKPLMNALDQPTPTPTVTLAPSPTFTLTPNPSQGTSTAGAQQTATAGAGATLTAIAPASSTPDPSQATSTAAAQQTATAGAGATLTAIVPASSTPDPSQATSTAAAQQTATAGAGATSTPDQSQATSTAAAQQTATAGKGATSTPDQSQATSTAAAQQTATAGAGATSTPSTQASATPDSSQATSTAIAGQTATAIAQGSATPTPSGPYVTTTLNASNLNVGDKTLVTVTMYNTPPEGYASAEFTCTYDPNLVDTSNYIITNLFGTDPAVITISPQAGTFVVGIAGSHGNKATTSGVAFTFEAKALQVGQTTINCTARISKGDGILTPLPSTGSALVILGAGSTPAPLPTATPQPGASPTPTTTLAPLGTISGQVIAYKPVTINVYDANNTLVASVPANPDGTFAITLPAGTYWVVATASGYLPAQGSFNVTGNAVTTLPTVALPAGDIDGNNVIDQFDALTVGMSYNTNVPASADLNNDGVVNVLDLDLLASNYRKTGPVVWQ